MHNFGPENISDDQILSAVDQLNSQFGGKQGGYDTRISFSLACIDPEGNPTNGINRFSTNEPGMTFWSGPNDLNFKNQIRWPTQDYLNVWVVKYLWGNTLGFSYNPPQGGLDGVVILHSEMGTIGTSSGAGSTTLSHEIGHYLNLLHVWGADSFSEGEDPCDINCDHLDLENSGDFVLDTSPCKVSAPSNNCNNHPTTCESCTGFPQATYFHPKSNYMSYHTACHTTFSAGQAHRMWCAIEDFRSTLPNEGCGSDCCPIIENTVWTEDRHLPCDLIIKNGAELTIDGATVFIDDEVNIIVERGILNTSNSGGAKLKLINGARLTSNNEYCEQNNIMWGGVMVEGAAREQFDSENQSNIFLDNATIEHSKHGILLGSRDENGNLSRGGASIQCTNTNFINNTVSIEFAAYSKGGAATFNNNDFIVNDNFQDEKFNEHVRLHNVKNIGFWQCEFSNDMTSHPFGPKGSEAGTGILSMDANFLVSDYDIGSVSKKSKFKNLRHGVRALQSVTNNTFEVRGSDFVAVQSGVSANSIENLKITDCKFIFGRHHSVDPNTNFNQFGVKLDNCNGYIISQNTFTEKTSFNNVPLLNPSNNLISTGTWVKNSGGEPNDIVENTFLNCDNSNSAIGWNKHPFIPTGLSYWCNDMIDNQNVDIEIITLSNTNEQGIASDQGSPDEAADNLFYPLSNFHIENGGGNISYFHGYDIFEEPTLVSLSVTNVEIGNDGPCGLEPHDPDNPQPPIPCPNWETGCLQGLYTNLISERDNLKNTFNNLLDNNDTPNLMISIEFDNPQEVISQLNSISPYLSNESLLLFLSYKDSKYNENDVATILASNPEVLHYKEIKNQVFNNNTWNSNNLQLLNLALQTTTSRSDLARSIAAKNKEIVKLKRKVATFILMQDYIDYSFLNSWYDIDNTFSNQLNLAYNYFMQDEFVSGFNILNGLDIINYDSGIQQLDIDLIKQTKALEINVLEQEGINYYEMNQAIKDELIIIAQNDNFKGGLQAANILEYFFNYDPLTIDYYQDYSNSAPPIQYKIKQEEKLIESNLIITPNPATHQFSIDLNSIKTNVDIRIYNNVGELKKTLFIENAQFVKLNANEIGQGLFYIEISPENDIKQVEKLIIF